MESNSANARFNAIAQAHPNAPAVVGPARTLTFAELQRAARQLARRLENEHGVTFESLVALHLERSCTMVVSILGVVFARGGYVPVELVLPEQRKLDILEDARPVAILATEDTAVLLPPAYRARVCLADEDRLLSPSAALTGGGYKM